MKTLHLRYYAALADQAGLARETVRTDAATLGQVYDEARARFGLRMERGRVRVALNDEFAAWDREPCEGDQVAFMPPVSGG